ncbi:unnamed protein product [Rotaria sp. Silwood1]|nr:unnamed protein product [Rotaria sp. Silwood1]CAF4585120.1 unnamed protein product [Rotaria sp. Silwood1]
MDIDSEPLSSIAGMSSLDEDLMERLRSITTCNREDLIAQFRSTTNAMLTDEGCGFFLEMSNWNLNEAILAYYDAEMPTDKIPQMRFIADVTVGEGEAIPPNTRFIKTWRVENSGTERWPNNCSLRFVNGDRLQDRDEIYVSSLAPGEQTNISVNITSPNVSRIIRSQWRLFTSAGVPFGDPIWLIASVEEGGIMGITQQLEQCHSLGTNINYPSHMNNPTGIQSSHNLLFQSSSINPLQSTRCNSNPNMSNGTEWMSYPLEYSRTSNINHPPPSTDSINCLSSCISSPGEQQGGDSEIDKITPSSPKSDSNTFIGKDRLLEQFKQQLKQFEEWNQRRDWLAFHHHHYDWWMFPIDEISSRGSTYQLPDAVINDLKKNEEFIKDLRQGVRLMVRSWVEHLFYFKDIDKGQLFDKLDYKQKWSYWPVRLYKAGRCMWLFDQTDYYQSLKKLAYYVKENEKEKLDFFSHTKNGKADVLQQWKEMEQTKTF